MAWILGVDPGVVPVLVRLIEEPGKQLAADVWDGSATSVEVLVGKSKRARPSGPLLRSCMLEALPDLVVIENVGSMPGEGSAGSFAFGFAAGVIEGVAAGLGLQVLKVAPRTWKAAFRFPAKADKNYSRHVASNIAPQLAHLWTKAGQHHRSDAFLMAYWARAQAEDLKRQRA